MDKFKAKLRQAWEEAPLQTALVGALVVQVGVKLLHELTEARKAHTWSREVDRRRMKY